MWMAHAAHVQGSRRATASREQGHACGNESNLIVKNVYTATSRGTEEHLPRKREECPSSAPIELLCILVSERSVDL